MDIVDAQKGEPETEIGKDTSVAEARWMLASVALLLVAVFAAGLIADILAG